MIHVCIAGVGLIGGSLGMALRKVKRFNKRVYKVTGYGRSQIKLLKAKRKGAVDSYSTLAKEVVSNADIVVLGVPIQIIPSLLKKILPHIRKGGFLTDVGSVKGVVEKDIKKILKTRPDIQFVGGHPIAGSEKVGVENAHTQLFQNSTCVLIKDRFSQRAHAKIQKMWKDTGARCLSMSASKHDQVLALTSHLPHLVSFSLFSVLSQNGKSFPNLFSLTGGSYRDMTRIAGADSKLWSEIFKANRKALLKGVNQFQKTLKELSVKSGKSLSRHLAKISAAKIKRN